MLHEIYEYTKDLTFADTRSPEYRLQGVILDISTFRLFQAVRSDKSEKKTNRPFIKNIIHHSGEWDIIVHDEFLISTVELPQGRYSTKKKAKTDIQKIITDIVDAREYQKPVGQDGMGEEITGSKLKLFDVMNALNYFKHKDTVRMVLKENGIKEEALFNRILMSFRHYIRNNIRGLPPDLHVLLSDLTIHQKGSVDGLVPYFLNHALEIFPHLEFMDDLKNTSDLSKPANWYMAARELNRKIIFHAGPTNSGKTYHALQRFKEAERALYCGPLRMLAQEVYKRTNEEGIECDLLTGEERLFVDPDENPANHLSCTVETASVYAHYDVAVIDEIQMIRDSQRGSAWTRVLLGLCANEIHVCGEASAIPIVRNITETTGDEFEIKEYGRLTKLEMSEKPVESFTNIQPGDCIVTFSKKDIYAVCQELEKIGKDAAVIYGGLPPATKRAQAEIFNDPDHSCKILVATDAIGMGLNLNIKRIVFYSVKKIDIAHQEDGSCLRRMANISTSQALQIAGRAGRFGTEYEDGEYTTFHADDYHKLKEILSKQVEPLLLAGLKPSADQVETFSYFMGNSSMKQVLEVFYNITTVDDTNYFLCEMSNFKALSSVIEDVEMTLRMKYFFCSAPVSIKDGAFISSIFLMYSRRCSKGIPTTFDFVCQRTGHPYKYPESLDEQMVLEQTYDALDLYLWLSYRFVDMFPDRLEVKLLRDELEPVILHGIRNLTKLFTSTDKTDKTDKKKSRK
ncbi:hypothetical protein FSP39_015211 [Pinctada imbricata]|uniref:RNA helicase n=1 Tax=Pinctada imbricata TaxID=66713 RepID=A0AA88Y0N6_PINIB|nr:hypothetical protein FSP39_015211 [Pinctada imbricata]